MNLKRTRRDTELWVVSRSNWSLPVLVDEYESDGKPIVCRILPAITLTTEQHQKLAETLYGLQDIRTSEGWLLSWVTLRTVARRAQGITVERYVKWKDRPAPPVDPSPLPTEEAAPPDAFIEHVHATLHPASIQTMRVVWLAICQSLPSYLMSGGVVDFGSLKLGAVPLRRSWVRLLFSRAQWIRQVYRAPDWSSRWKYEAERIVRNLTAGDMMATAMKMVGGKFRSFHRWTCCVVHDPSWNRCERDVEVDQLARLGPVDYVRRWASLVAGGLPFVHQVLREEATGETLPGGRLRPGRDGVGLELAQAPATEVRDGEIVEFDRDGRASPMDAWSVAARFAYIEQANGSLLEVPPVQPATGDVRNSGGDGGSDDHVRVLVPRGDSEPSEGEGLLGKGDEA